MEKMRKETELQADIGAISDRKNAERTRSLEAPDPLHLPAGKGKGAGRHSGEKVRALSELVKMKGFVSRVQAINAVLEKERQGLRLEKMQLAQAMASNIEDVRKFKAEMEQMKISSQNEAEGLMRRYQAETQKFREDHAAEVSAGHAQNVAEMGRRHEEETLAAGKRSQEELARGKAADAADLEIKTAELRNKYESEIKDLRTSAKIEMKQEYVSELVRLKAEKAQAESDRVRLEAELKRAGEESRAFDARLALSRREADDARSSIADNYKRLEAQFGALMEVKADYERRFAAIDAERGRLVTEYASLKAQFEAALAAKASRERDLTVLEQNFKAESENRARFESELLFLKANIQQLELQVQDAQAQIEAEKKNSAHARDEAAKRAHADKARIAAVAAELEAYKQLEASFSGRIKWALKGKKQ